MLYSDKKKENNSLSVEVVHFCVGVCLLYQFIFCYSRHMVVLILCYMW